MRSKILKYLDILGRVVLALALVSLFGLIVIMTSAFTADEHMATAEAIEAPEWMNTFVDEDGNIVEKPRVYRDALNEKQQELYDRMERTMRTMSFCCSMDDVSYEELYKVFCSVLNDNSDIFWADRYICIPSSVNLDSYVFMPLYGFASFDQIKEKHSEFMEGFEHAAQEVRDWAKVSTEKVYASGAARKVCERLHYGHNISDQNITAFFGEHDGETVCVGYARSYTMLCSALGIECYYVSGSSKDDDEASHAWNMLKTDGTVQWADLTWGDIGEYVADGYLTSVEESFAPKHYPADAVAESRIAKEGEFQSMIRKSFEYKNVQIAQGYPCLIF